MAVFFQSIPMVSLHMKSPTIRLFIASAVFLASSIVNAQQSNQPPLSPQEAALREEIRQMYKKMGREPSDAELEAALAAFRQKQAAMIGSVLALQSQMQSGGNPAAVMPANNQLMGTAMLANGNPAGTHSMTENELRGQIDAWQPFSGAASVKMMRDGIEINGQQILDPEGRISQYSFDEATGNLGYVVDLPNGVMAVKVTRAGVTTPIKIATLAKSGAAWSTQLATGTSINGNNFSVQPNGFVISRESSIFVYQAGKGMSSYSAPQGYVVAPLQKGNIATTGYILLERENATGGDNAFSSMASSVKAIGKVFGATTKEDYALMRVADARLVPINVEADSKTQSVGRNCRQRNAFINDCKSMVSFESLWTNVGTRSQHYYWRIDWVQTKVGPVAVVNEGSTLNIVTLNDGAKIPVFNRTLGINEFDLTRSHDGTLGLRIKAGLSTETVPDIVAAMGNPQSVSNQAAAGK